MDSSPKCEEVLKNCDPSLEFASTEDSEPLEFAPTEDSEPMQQGEFTLEEQDGSTNLNAVGETKCNNKFWLKVEILLVSVLIIGVWILLSLPFIFYQLPVSEVRINVAL